MLSLKFELPALRILFALVCLCASACESADEDPQQTGAVSGGADAAARGEAGGRPEKPAPTKDGGVAGKQASPDAGRAGASAAGSGGKPASGAAGSAGAASDAGAAGAATDAGAAGSSSMEDAGVADVDAAVSCEGTIVAGRERCLQDDAFCFPLADGRYCTGPRAPKCPPNYTPIAKDIDCPARTECFDYSESLRCAKRLYTIEECTEANGVALADPGDGSLVCPNDAAPLGGIDGAGWDEGGLCCPAAKQCGARAGDTCTAAEYCAYQAGQLCGQADAQATCRARPSSCSAPSAPVCGCDQRTYSSACEANAAGIGVFSDSACP